MRISEDTIEVGAFEAKNRLSELLRAAEAGQSIVITRRGRPVARLISAVEDQSEDLVELKTAFQLSDVQNLNEHLRSPYPCNFLLYLSKIAGFAPHHN